MPSWHAACSAVRLCYNTLFLAHLWLVPLTIGSYSDQSFFAYTVSSDNWTWRGRRLRGIGRFTMLLTDNFWCPQSARCRTGFTVAYVSASRRHFWKPAVFAFATQNHQSCSLSAGPQDRSRLHLVLPRQEILILILILILESNSSHTMSSISVIQENKLTKLHVASKVTKLASDF